MHFTGTKPLPKILLLLKYKKLGFLVEKIMACDLLMLSSRLN